MQRFIIKKKMTKKMAVLVEKPLHDKPIVKDKQVIENKIEIQENMDTQDKIRMATALLNQEDESLVKVKKMRKDKGLIEKTESSKIILTEDNRELLND